MTALRVQFTVHGVVMASVPVQVEYEGKPINAMVDCLEVELNSDNPRHGNPTLRFVGDEIPAALEIFKQDAKVIISAEAADAAEKEAA